MSAPKARKKTSNTTRVTLVLIAVFGLALVAAFFGKLTAFQKARAKAGPRTQETLAHARKLRREAAYLLTKKSDGKCPKAAEVAAAMGKENAGFVKDGWGNEFRIRCEGGTIKHVISAGADGTFGAVSASGKGDGVSDDLYE